MTSVLKLTGENEVGCADRPHQNSDGFVLKLPYNDVYVQVVCVGEHASRTWYRHVSSWRSVRRNYPTVVVYEQSQWDSVWSAGLCRPLWTCVEP